MDLNSIIKKEVKNMKKKFTIMLICTMAICMAAAVVIVVDSAARSNVLAESARKNEKSIMLKRSNYEVMFVPDDGQRAVIAENLSHPESIYPMTETEIKTEIEERSNRGAIASEIWDQVCGFFDDPMVGSAYYGGSYPLSEREYGADVPYIGDGTMEQLKFVILIVEGREAEAQPLVDRLSAYEDYIIYRKVEKSVKEREDLINDILIPELEGEGISVLLASPLSTYSIHFGGVTIGVLEEDFDRACDIAERIALEYGVLIHLEGWDGPVEVDLDIRPD